MKYSLEAINSRLKAARMGVVVVQRGNRLSLRATLPPRPGSKASKPAQQYLSLGIYANPAGLKVAEEKAKELSVDIARWKGTGIFNWDKWQEGEKQPGNSCKYWVEAFKEEFLNRQESFSPDTWNRHYSPIFSRLPQEAEISEENFIKTLLTIESNTWNRQRVVSMYQRLADFAGLNIDLSKYRGDYSRSKHKPKVIPSDDEILIAYGKLVPNSPWQWIYGMLATYGLRPHEAFFCEISPNPPHACKVLEGKTGDRICYPLRPEWVDRWQLYNMRLPSISSKNFYSKYGNAVRVVFWRRSLGFSPYCLRHAYAIRAALTYKVPIPTAAAWMGHSPELFLNTYNRWISQAEHERVFWECTKD